MPRGNLFEQRASFLRSLLKRERVCVHWTGILIVWKLLYPFHYKTLWLICVSGCVRHGGNWMVQTLGHMFTNWLPIMHGWPRLSSQELQGALPIFCMDSSWNW